MRHDPEMLLEATQETASTFDLDEWKVLRFMLADEPIMHSHSYGIPHPLWQSNRRPLLIHLPRINFNTMQSVQESKQELEAAVRYAENAISSAKTTIETLEFRQEMAKKQYSESTGREQALQAQVEDWRSALPT